MSTSLRKRKIRKGTQSCWECKRRKTRCIFTALGDSTCVGCKSRGTTCLSQEFHEGVSTTSKKTTQSKRLTLPSCSSQDRPERETIAKSKPKKPETSQKGSDQPSEVYRSICYALAKVWPSDADLNLIHRVPSQDFGILNGPLNSPYSSLEFQNNVSPQDVLRLPPYGAHPVLVARKVLLLSAFLRRFPLQVSNDTSYAGDLADRLLNTAIELVTSDDALLDSIEGIECVALESMVHNYCGNLRRSLLSLRKAMVLAQLMGLHRNGPFLSLKVIDQDTQSRIDPSYVWFRLVESDRYLSLMLGVPQAWSDNAFLEKNEFETCSPMEQLERLHLVVGGRILDRNERDAQDLAITQEIDHLLQCASSCLAPVWWLTPDPSRKSSDDLMWTRQIMIQITHYFLVTQLHFPYLVSSLDSHVITYSKITTVNASRDILSRFLALRSDTTLTSYCRGVDFIAFFASAALCVAHIAGNRGHVTLFDHDSGVNPFSYFTHQRASDRGLAEKTLEHMKETARCSHDAIASKLVNLLQPLLVMEGASQTGALVNADFIPDGYSDDHGCSGQVGDGGNALLISIPHCGKIHVTRATPDIDLLPTLNLQLNLDSDWLDPAWVTEADQPTVGCAVNQTSECSELVEGSNPPETHV